MFYCSLPTSSPYQLRGGLATIVNVFYGYRYDRSVTLNQTQQDHFPVVEPFRRIIRSNAELTVANPIWPTRRKFMNIFSTPLQDDLP